MLLRSRSRRSPRPHDDHFDDLTGRPGAKLPKSCLPVKRHRGEPGHTRDRHTNRTNRTPSKPTHPPTRARQTTPKPRQSTPKPRDARVATNRTTHPIKRGGGDGHGDGAQTRERERRGRESDGIGGGTPPRAGRRGGTRLRRSRAADGAHGSCPARTGHYARCAALEAESLRERQKASWRNRTGIHNTRCPCPMNTGRVVRFEPTPF